MRKTRLQPVQHTALLPVLLCLLTLQIACIPNAMAAQPTPAFAAPYGVFLSCDATQMDRFADYQTIVIDAAYFEKADVGTLKAAGHTVYTYLNVGALEDFRPYYARFVDQTLAPYEHWEGERWMDVSDPLWQAYLCDTLAADYLDKGVDGFFIDNCDVYYLYPTEAIFDGLSAVLRKLTATGAAVLINGGDMFVTTYADRYGGLSDIMTGVNQESVFSSIDFDRRTFGRATKDDHAYFTDYIERVASLGGKVYLLEYTIDPSLVDEIADYCTRMGYTYYVSDSIELD